MAQIINEGIVKQNQSVIYETGILMLLLSFLVATIAITVSFLASNISAKGAARLRASIFSKVSSFDSGEMELFTTASLITRATNDVLQVQNASLMILRMGFFAPAMGIGALIMAIRTSHDLTWTIVITLVSLLFFVFLSEMYPTKVRGLAMSIAGLSLWIGTYLVGQLTPWLLETLTQAGTFMLFALMCIPYILIVWKLMPETTGKSLEEIEGFWKK